MPESLEITLKIDCRTAESLHWLWQYGTFALDTIKDDPQLEYQATRLTEALHLMRSLTLTYREHEAERKRLAKTSNERASR